MNRPHYFDPQDIVPPRPVGQREYLAFRDLLQLVLRHAVLLTLCCVVALLAGLGYFLTAETTYRAQAQLLLDPKLPQIFREASDLGLAVDTGQIETHMAVLRSRAIATAVVDRLQLWKDPEFQQKPGLGLLSGLTGRSTAPGEPHQVAVDIFLRHLRIEREGISQVINVAVLSRSGARAAQLTNETTRAYIQYLIDARAESARSASEWLEQRLAQLRLAMNAAAKRAQNFRASNESATLEELQLSAETYRKTYQDFYSAFTEAVQRESYPVSTVRVVSQAVAPAGPYAPNALLVFGGALLAGLAAGLLLAILRDGRGAAATARAGRTP